MNNVNLMGRITKDLELRYSNSGMALLSFTVAVNRTKKDEADFISCKAFDKTAENINTYFKKGSLIAITGHIQTGNYTKEDGTKVYTTDVVVDRFYFTGEKKEEQAQQPTQFTQAENQSIDDELPF